MLISGFYAQRQSVSMDKCHPMVPTHTYAKWDICTMKCRVHSLNKPTNSYNVAMLNMKVTI